MRGYGVSTRWVIALAWAVALVSACDSSENEGHSHNQPEDVTETPNEDASDTPDVEEDTAVDAVDVNEGDEPDVDASVDVGPGEDVEQEVEACDWQTIAAEAWNLRESAVDEVVTALDVQGEGWRVSVDATLGGTAGAAASSWVYLDLTTGTQLLLGDLEAQDSTDWHLAFKRTAIRVNGGESGPRGVYVVPWDAAWDELTEMPDVPRGSFRTDSFVDEDCALVTEGRGTPATAFGTWFDYDFETHTATAPEGIVWVVYAMDTHATFRLQIESLENNGVYTLRGAPFAGGAR